MQRAISRLSGTTSYGTTCWNNALLIEDQESSMAGQRMIEIFTFYMHLNVWILEFKKTALTETFMSIGVHNSTTNLLKLLYCDSLIIDNKIKFLVIVKHSFLWTMAGGWGWGWWNTVTVLDCFILLLYLTCRIKKINVVFVVLLWVGVSACVKCRQDNSTVYFLR